MIARLQERWADVRSSWWFLPSVMALGAVLISVITTTLDSAFSDELEQGFGLYGGGPEGSRSVLETVAGSMITVAGVTFSIAIVVMTLASSQFGPRLLRTFMRSVGNQVTLGTFVATFIFSVLVLRTVRTEDGDQAAFVPHLSVSVAMLLTLASLTVFIYFIHHSARSLQVGQIVAAVSRDMEKALDDLFPGMIGEDGAGEEPEQEASGGVPLTSEQSAYVQMINGRELLSATNERDVVVELAVAPGDFVLEGATLAYVRPAERLDEDLSRRLRRAISLGDQRTEQQDVGFAFDQLQQICLRALSPALNDPLTAGMCIDRMAAGLARLAESELPSRHRLDDDGSLRVLAEPPSLEAMLRTAFADVRRSARDNVAASLRLLQALGAVGARASRPEDLAALRGSAVLIVEEASPSLTAEDLALLGEAQRAALAVIDGAVREPPPLRS
ncbi:MAG TPA: DUF2254 domain-containing protein [Candidatus Limnocylindria bacterium]|nr:DUF2254 domain-containing protein [Candidatus Limnocylindria bacterium]